MTENFESVLEKVGGWGKYQIIMTGLISLTFIPLGFFIFTAVFTYYTPPHRCYIPAIDEFNLVCDNAWKKPVLTSGLIVGLFIGSFLSGPISDKLGRRVAYMSNLVLSSICSVAFSCVPTFELALLAIVLVGATQMIWYNSSYILDLLTIGMVLLYAWGNKLEYQIDPMSAVMCCKAIFTSGILYIGAELVDRKHRATVSCLNNVVYAIGYTLLPPVAYALVDWRWIIRVYGLTCVAFTPYILFIPESPRWLASKGKTVEAFKIMKSIARVNGKDVSVLEDLKLNNFDASECLLDEDKPKSGERARRKSSVEILVTNGVMRRRSILICWIWNVSFLCYYALGYNTSNLGGNNYWNCFIAAAMEIPCFVFVTFSIQRFGRRNSISTFIGLTGIFLGISPMVAFANSASITFAMLGKFFAAATQSILFLYTSELYPTLLRSTGLGIASLASRLGSVCAPFLVYVGESGYKYVPFYVMAALGVVTSLLCLFLPETKQSPLPDTIADAIDLERFSRISCYGRKKRVTEDEKQIELESMESPPINDTSDSRNLVEDRTTNETT